MGFLSFLRPRAQPAAPAVSMSVMEPPPVPAPVEPPAGDPDAIVVRAEIVDTRNRLCGYRFSVPLGGSGLPLAEPLAIDTLTAARLPEFAHSRLALVQLSMDAVVAQHHLPLIAPHTIFMLDRKSTELPVTQIAERIAALRQSGCKVALRGVSLDADDVPLLALCDLAMLY